MLRLLVSAVIYTGASCIMQMQVLVSEIRKHGTLLIISRLATCVCVGEPDLELTAQY